MIGLEVCHDILDPDRSCSDSQSIEVKECNDQLPKRERRRRRGKRGRGREIRASFSGMGFSKVTPSPFCLLQGRSDFSTPISHRSVSMDCEMVGVGPRGTRSVLARVSIVDWFGNVVFDTFVKVQERVTDYRTFVSGIRASDLEGPSAMDFGSCRATVQRILQNRILVGHGLSNDLKVLHLKHPWFMTRDSATFKPFLRPNHSPRRLRDLVMELGIGIQQEGQEHDSVEDAWAAMSLYRFHQVYWDDEIRSSLMQRPLGELMS